MRTTVRLSDHLLRRARKKAAEQGRTLTSLLEEGLRTVLTESKPARRTQVRLPVSKATGGTLPGVDLNRSSDLEDRMENR
jgi:hypothetical protein